MNELDLIFKVWEVLTPQIYYFVACLIITWIIFLFLSWKS